MIYPYNQHILEKDINNISTNKLSHDRERCAKCIEYGKLRYSSKYY